MYSLAVAFPAVRGRQLPLSRDQMILLLVAFNEIMLGVETLLAHLVSGTIVYREWIPVLFGPVAGVALLAAGLLALRHRGTAAVLASGVFAVSIVVGLLGAYYHLVRAALPHAPLGERISVDLLVWAPPVLGPLTFALAGLMGLSAAWLESPTDSGALVLPGDRRLRMPYSKTRAYYYLVALGSLATVISSVLDHARTDFANPWLWLATAIGVFGTVVAASLGAVEAPTRLDIRIYVMAMVLMLLVGVTGSVLHIGSDLVSRWVIVPERFLRGAPPLAPLLFSDMGLIGLAVLLDPTERLRRRRGSA